jgi:alanyl-tRNA synthetase
MIIQQKETIFETDIFVPILEYLEEFLQQTYPPFSHKTSELSPQQKTLTRSFRIITDHSRASVFLIADGVLPSNEGR